MADAEEAAPRAAQEAPVQAAGPGLTTEAEAGAEALVAAEALAARAQAAPAARRTAFKRLEFFR